MNDLSHSLKGEGIIYVICLDNIDERFVPERIAEQNFSISLIPLP